MVTVCICAYGALVSVCNHHACFAIVNAIRKIVYCGGETVNLVCGLAEKMKGQAESAAGPYSGQGRYGLYRVGKRFGRILVRLYHRESKNNH